MKTNLTKAVIMFVALTISGVCLVVFGQAAAVSDVRNTLPLIGAAMFSAGLTYLMVKTA